MAVTSCLGNRTDVFAVCTGPLTAYLATSPGGADSVAIIAAGSHVDVPFVMTMQMARFVAVLVLGPAMGKWAARQSGTHAGAPV